MSVRMLPAAVAARLRAEAGQDFCGPPGRIDLCVRVSRDRQRRAALFHAGQISPGAVLWPEQGKSDAEKEALLRATPLARAGTPAELAEAVRWLLQDASYCTGQILRVDGGRSIS